MVRSGRSLKRRVLGERIDRLGAAEGLRIADELRRQALLSDPAWPRPDARAADLAAHVHLSALFRRADRTSRA